VPERTGFAWVAAVSLVKLTRNVHGRPILSEVLVEVLHQANRVRVFEDLVTESAAITSLPAPGRSVPLSSVGWADADALAAQTGRFGHHLIGRRGCLDRQRSHVRGRRQIGGQQLALACDLDAADLRNIIEELPEFVEKGGQHGFVEIGQHLG